MDHWFSSFQISNSEFFFERIYSEYDFCLYWCPCYFISWVTDSGYMLLLAVMLLLTY